MAFMAFPGNVVYRLFHHFDLCKRYKICNISINRERVNIGLLTKK
jgi:hypothetical protein